MAVVGTVSRAMGDTIVNAQQSSQGNVAAFVARSSSGATVGYFRSAGEAQAAINQTNGTILRWSRQDLRGDIEFYVGEN